MTITPDMLTQEAGKEAGFVEGVVTQIGWENYSPSIEYYVWGSAMEHSQKEYMITQYAVSIRPLTGPLAHWSLDCVPEDAQWSVVHSNGVDFISAEEWEAAKMGGIVWDGQVSRRPWWCGRKGQ